jgi:hypothetical protein
LANTIVEKKSYPFSYFDRKIEAAIAGLPREYSKLLYKIPKDNALKIADYIISLKTEINLSDNYRKDLIKVLSKFSIFCCSSHDNKLLSFDQLGREDIVAFLNSFRRPEASDPSETLENQKEKDAEVRVLQEKYEADIKSIREEMERKFEMILSRIDIGKLS